MMKEIGHLLSQCFDEQITTKIKLFEAKRIQQLYARMAIQSHKVPDFKSRLTLLREQESDAIPGFAKMNRAGQANEKLQVPIEDLQSWFKRNEE